MSAVTTVPFTDIAAATREVWPAIEQDYLACLRSGEFIGGRAVAAFEQAWADFCGTGYAVGVANGTDALELTLTALGVGHGDEVVVPANTFIATAAAVVRCGAVPRFADVDDETLLMTPLTLKAAITARTRAAIAVHLYGQMADMPALADTADDAGIFLIEDAAQAHGAEWDGRRAGSLGVAGCFSFYPAKNVGAFGDAGAVVTSDARLADRVRALANHGRVHGSAHYEHEFVGTNSRLDALQAIALMGKLARIDAWTQRRIALAARYRGQLAGTGIRPVGVASEARHVYHLFVVRAHRRDELRMNLDSRGIRSAIHYPVPCHVQPPLRRFAMNALPVTEQASGELLSLPMFPQMTDGQVDTVCAALAELASASAVA